jgi:hypothetical protein
LTNSIFSEKSYLLVKEEINALIKSKVAQACSTTIGPLLEHDTLPSVAQLAVRVASKKAAVFCKQWERKSVYKGDQDFQIYPQKVLVA